MRGAEPLLAVVDVHYDDASATAVAACITFRDWRDEAPVEATTVTVGAPKPYEPGAFYRRELPCVLAVLDTVSVPLRCVVVDGYVWLGADEPGLGAHLYTALEKRVPVVGVAKTAYRGARAAAEVLRGQGAKPLYVTAAGMDPSAAAKLVESMHGPHRIPTLLRRVDRLCRGGVER